MIEIIENNFVLSEDELTIINKFFKCLGKINQPWGDIMFNKITKLNELAKTYNAIIELETGGGKEFSSFKKMVEEVNEGVSER